MLTIYYLIKFSSHTSSARFMKTAMDAMMIVNYEFARTREGGVSWPF
jgi:hypothetical protein